MSLEEETRVLSNQWPLWVHTTQTTLHLSPALIIKFAINPPNTNLCHSGRAKGCVEEIRQWWHQLADCYHSGRGRFGHTSLQFCYPIRPCDQWDRYDSGQWCQLSNDWGPVVFIKDYCFWVIKALKCCLYWFSHYLLQAKGRGRAEDSSYTLVEVKNSGVVEKECVNEYRTKMMDKAIDKIRALNQADYDKRVCSL